MAIFTGTDSNDSYLATTAGDNARGGRGDDTLIGNSGQDTLNGNADNDLLRADSATQTAGGNDSLLGGQGNDTLLGAQFGFSADSLAGNKGEDLLIASTNGGDTLFGGQGDDTIYGSLSNGNTMNGDLGNDVLIAGRGNDRMLGGDGNDTLIGGTGNNDMFGGIGNDQFQFFSAIDGDISVLTGPEQVVRARGGFGGSDVINDFATGDTISISQLDRNAKVTFSTNSAGATVIAVTGTASDGQSTNNQTITIVGVTRDQLLAPGSQLLAINGRFITTNDTVNDGAGGSVFTVGDGQSGANIKGKQLVGSPIADSLSPIAGVATLANGILLQSTVNDDTLLGNDGNDFLDGGAGNDSINGGDATSLEENQDISTGGDTLVGGLGNDTLTGGGDKSEDSGISGADIFRFTNFTPGEIDVITDFVNFETRYEADVVEISAAAFGGSLIPGQNGASSPGLVGEFQYLDEDGAPPSNATSPIGISSFYWDQIGYGLYFDRDGGGTGTFYVQFAKLIPLLGGGNPDDEDIVII
jgi:Ca2+-binding RTX toxin-like protein